MKHHLKTIKQYTYYTYKDESNICQLNYDISHKNAKINSYIVDYPCTVLISILAKCLHFINFLQNQNESENSVYVSEYADLSLINSSKQIMIFSSSNVGRLAEYGYPHFQTSQIATFCEV